MSGRKYFLDTNICIDYLRGRHAHIRERFLSMSPAEIEIPSVVKAELYYGAEKSDCKEKNIEMVRAFLAPFEIAPFDGAAAEMYGTIRAGLERAGLPIGPNDLIVATTALSRNGILVTRNVGEFSRVTGLTIENWAVD
ncbi:type II toxin-antitoxin system VapC family toxin [Synergistaceae bacterium OttesenSCG-928-I11]|nr:type II toxin-antitoxin system VapC family toxin [Synergistaceae bacterium OttesenSCG-928-I11]